ncbi:A24 family peptidase [Sphingosinicella sp.]|uniref:A24 family peptidase n=1 Tax=Sphingosinicella sp. TaxID=1917971 RepID=UPI004037CBA4
MWIVLPWALLAVLAVLLLAASWGDLTARTIPNGLNLAIALLATPFWWANGLPFWPDVALQVGVAALVFAVFAGAFAIGAMGGGDVKLIGALALWLPWPAVLALLVIMSLAGGALTLAMLIRKRLARTAGALEIPYGVAIAFGGLWLISERFLYQFG